MEKEKLTGIERELVLQYLIDGNVPVTLTPIEEPISSNSDDTETEIKALTTQIFPVAIKGENIKVKKNGTILLENPVQSVANFANKTVKVEFYFNRVGLYFISEVQETKKGLSIQIPDQIERIADFEEDADYDFSSVIYFDCKSRRDLNLKCVPFEGVELFVRPVWKNIALEYQKLAKKLLEDFVEQAKQEKNAGNGIQLIPVCKYLAEPHNFKLEAMENRVKPFSILFVDHERLVVGMETQACTFFVNDEYGIKLSFSIKRGPILSRDIFVTSSVNKIYRSADGLHSCVDFKYTTMQEEDLRFLFEKATSTLLS
ncbi:MAG: hypothetical protein J6X84_02875 [Treponema sp.]|nr:hypothetical protein [Treponema sp.]